MTERVFSIVGTLYSGLLYLGCENRKYRKCESRTRLDFRLLGYGLSNIRTLPS